MRERHVHPYLQNRALGGGVRSPECGELNTPRKLRGFLEAVTFPRDSRMEATVFHRPGTCTRAREEVPQAAAGQIQRCERRCCFQGMLKWTTGLYFGLGCLNDYVHRNHL